MSDYNWKIQLFTDVYNIVPYDNFNLQLNNLPFTNKSNYCYYKSREISYIRIYFLLTK
jgi:hypothetical protein